MKINPKEMFIGKEKYTKYDEDGIPTHQFDEKEGEKEVPKV